MKSLFASILVLSACSSDPLAPGSGDDPGTGTNSLLVEGRASAEPRFANASGPSDFDVDFEVSVSLNGNRVTTGTVTLTSQFNTVNLTWRDSGGTFGTWEGSIGAYDEVYQLDVISGADEVRGVIVDGPDIAVFTAPTAGATLDSTIINTVTWSRDDVADITTFRAKDFDRINISDTGTYAMGIGTLKAEKDQARDNTLELRRTRHTVPRGAVTGSDFAVSVEQTLDVLVQPNPAL